MLLIRPHAVPCNTFLRRYKDGPGFADCYVAEVSGAITQAAFIEAFYTSPLFKLERTLLACLVRKPATDADARMLAAGKTETFSAWRVEAQSATELLLADMTGQTRSWLMALPVDAGNGGITTRLHFGSAVLPRPGSHGQRPAMGWIFHALQGFHRVYSRLLLKAACKRLNRINAKAASAP
ncbi:MAG: hypothetical protein H6943_03325 [Zoogloeaceae bacterium]|nr:hypothetical protein [Zoogloeaceae bacterium]